MSISWTKEQSDAIHGTGGDIYLSAAAGSGKTAVLSERVLTMITREEEPANIDRLLIVTFTRAAASEMKERIYKKLNSALKATPNNKYLKEQLSRLPYASISTIHSFCLNFVTAYFQRLDISPNVRVASENEIKSWRADCISEIVSERYEMKEKSEFLSLVEYLSGGRNDNALVEAVISVYEFLRSLPFYESWCDNRLKLYDASSVEESIWGEVVLNYAKGIADYAIAQASNGIEHIKNDNILYNNYGIPLEDDLLMLTQLKKLLDEKDGFDKAGEFVYNFKHKRVGAKKGADEWDKEFIKDVRNRVKKSVDELKEQLTICTTAEFLEDIADLKHKMKELFSLALDLDKKMKAKKQEESALDFADLEHFMLSLLLTPKDQYGDYEPTDLAKELKGNFDSIMVDECQDINEVQDLIFKTISDNNLFMVGDVKQSIYSFRQARPELFVGKLKSANAFDNEQFPSKILLSNNFRSREKVTTPINDIFSAVMREEIGGVEYGKDECLNPSAPYAETLYTGVDIHYLSDDNLPEDVTKEEYQALYIASELKELIESGFMVSDGKGGLRKASYSDAVVLLRSPRRSISTYRKSFEKLGVAVNEEETVGFFNTNEIRTMVNLLKVIDNPLLSRELLGVAISPFAGISADDIAKIRMSAGSKQSLYNNFRKKSSEYPKVASLLEKITYFREKSVIMPVSELILHIYNCTSIELIYRTMPFGERRYGNLLLLAEYVAGWEAVGVTGLTNILRFIDGMEEREEDLTSVDVTGVSDAVTIMSIHKSKGLEFPIVVLGSASKRFNKGDIHSNVILDNNLGFTAMRRDRVRKCQFKTLPLNSAKIKSTENLIAEELRILYVALTRAREKLIVVGNVADADKYISQREEILTDGRLSAFELLKQNSYLDIITSAVSSSSEFIASLKNQPTDKISVKIANMLPIETKDTNTSNEEVCEIDNTLIAKVMENKAFSYKYPNATKAPTKLSVSELAEKDVNEDRLFKSKPRFMLGDSISAAEKGTAVHTFMQLCNLENASKDVKAELDRMLSLGVFNKRQASSVEVDRIEKFFASSLWEALLNSDRYLREHRFVSYLKDEIKGEYKVAEDGEKTVLQGIADLILVKGDSAILVDFKTDRIKDKNKLVDRYKKQLMLYKEMLSDSLGLKVEKAILYSFYLNIPIEISFSD